MENNKVLNRALCLSYIYSKLTLENLEVAVHEMQLLKNKDAKKLKGYLNKVIEANQNAFRVIERNTPKDDLQSLHRDLSKLIDVAWEDSNGKTL
jgi:hypothetical protein